MPNEKSPNGLGYETRDVGWPLVLWSLGIITGFTILAICLVAILFPLRESLPQIRKVQPVATAESRPIPAGPLLQPRPPLDLQEYQAESMAHLSSYGWVDEADGVVRVPIDRGIDMALEKGFPTGTPAPAAEGAEEAAAPEGTEVN